MTNILLSIPPKFFFESFIDKCVTTFIDSTLETFHFPLLFQLLPSSDPGHKKFWKCENRQHVKSAESPLKMCIAHVSIVTEEYLGFPQ